MQVNGYLVKMCKDPELKQTKSGKNICNFTVASNYGWGENKGTDFIRCVAWNKTAEMISKNFHKGDNLIIEGRWHDRPYQKNEHGYDIPNWVYSVDNVVFLPRVKAPTLEDEYKPGFDVTSDSSSDDFSEIHNDGDLPF